MGASSQADLLEIASTCTADDCWLESAKTLAAAAGCTTAGGACAATAWTDSSEALAPSCIVCALGLALLCNCQPQGQCVQVWRTTCGSRDPSLAAPAAPSQLSSKPSVAPNCTRTNRSTTRLPCAVSGALTMILSHLALAQAESWPVCATHGASDAWQQPSASQLSLIAQVLKLLPAHQQWQWQQHHCQRPPSICLAV
jgi:hypothetical protein